MDVFSWWFDVPGMNQWMNSDDIREVLSVVSVICDQQLHRCLLPTRSRIEGNDSSVNEVKQYHYRACASIFKTTYLLLQSYSSRLSSDFFDSAFWTHACETVLAFPYAEAVPLLLPSDSQEHHIAAAQLLVFFLSRSEDTNGLVGSIESIIVRRSLNHQAITLLTKSLLHQCDFHQLLTVRSDSYRNGYVLFSFARVVTPAYTTTDELVYMMQTALVFFEAFRGVCPENVAEPVVEGCLSLCVRHLDNSTRKVSRMSEECLGVLVRECDVVVVSSPEGQKRGKETLIRPVLQQALQETQTTRRQFSILTVLLANESVKEVLQVVPELVENLLSMMCERNSCFCAQITTVLITLIVRNYEETSEDGSSE